jgi:hypothetical protein
MFLIFVSRALLIKITRIAAFIIFAAEALCLLPGHFSDICGLAMVFRRVAKIGIIGATPLNNGFTIRDFLLGFCIL